MSKTSSKIIFLIGGIVSVIAAILGIIYVLGGNTVEGSDKTYFVGHVLNSDGTVNDSEMPEALAFICMTMTFLVAILWSIPVIIETKGMPRSSKKAIGRKLIISQIGLIIMLISGIALGVLAPNDSWTLDEYHGVGIYIVFMIGLIIGTILIIIDVIRVLMAKAPIMY